jgi:hypothetical protein
LTTVVGALLCGQCAARGLPPEPADAVQDEFKKAALAELAMLEVECANDATVGN